MNKRTSGPWHVDSHSNQRLIRVKAANRVVADMAIRRNSPLVAEGLENAALIAAAPELISAAEEMLIAFAEGVIWNEQQRLAYETLSVAVGKVAPLNPASTEVDDE